MVAKVELVPVAEGNRITVKKDEKIIIGRGSLLGCNEKKISRQHAELLLKDDNTLWIKPTHANPVFYRPLNGKTTQLPKDVEQELNDGDLVGLLPSSFFFRVTFSLDVNNNNDDESSDTDSDLLETREMNKEKTSPVRETSSDQWSPIRGYRRSISNQDTSVFDFDDDDDNDNSLDITRTKPKRTSLENKSTLNRRSDSQISITKTSTTTNSTSVPSRTDEDKDESELNSSIDKTRKLPKWMAATSPTSSSKVNSTTPKPAYSRNSSYTAPVSTKRNLSFDGDSNSSDLQKSSSMSDIRSSPTVPETKSPGRVLSRIPSTKSFDSDSGDGTDVVVTKTPSTPTLPKRLKPGVKRRPPCPFGSSCYRKNPIHRSEQAHPGDSDYDDSKKSYEIDSNEDNDINKPECPFGKSCYRQNPQHKRDFRH